MKSKEEQKEYNRVYAKGYAAGSSGRWPEHKPPKPPDAQVSALFVALRELIEAVDGELAKFLPEDELVVTLKPALDKADEALYAVGVWLKEEPN